MKRNETYYSFHIMFTDGSNPFVSYHMWHDTFKKRIREWMKNYNLTIDKIIRWPGSETIYYNAVPCDNNWIEKLSF